LILAFLRHKRARQLNCLAFFIAVVILILMNEETKKQIEALELEMASPDFWANKDRAQEVIKELKNLKEVKVGGGKYDGGDAVITIFAGAGGDDAEDFSAMLYRMYGKYFEKKGWSSRVLHVNENNHGGFRNITFEVLGRGVYGTLKRESGVHRLVRVSPFNAQKKRHTSFTLVEVIPKFEKVADLELKEDDLKIEFAKSSGPGGQNVNKRETAARIVHLPTKISAHVDSERSQHANKERALAIIKGKLFKYLEDERVKKVEGMYVSKTTEIEWGSQIRSYVLHPYKMVKDHRTGVETTQVDKVLEGDIEEFIEAEKAL